ncbi:unnamed protein product, partial [Rotaria sordida]
TDFQTVSHHNHKPNHSAGQVATARTSVTDAVATLSDNAISSLTNLRNLKRNVQRIR